MLADVVERTIVSDSNATRLDRLRALAEARRIPRVSFSAKSAREALDADGPFDAVLMLSGWGGVDEEELFRGLKPSGQLALQLTGSPGSALKASRRLREVGFSSTSILVPWPITARAPVAWVDTGSAQAWHTLLDRWLPNIASPARRGFERVWRKLADHSPDAVRHLTRWVAPTFCILGTR